MKHLVYCVLRDPGTSPVDWPVGLDGEAVSLFVENGLAAAFSLVADESPPSLPRLLSYARVIDALHQRVTVLPMRYGCLLDDVEEMRELLQKRRARFEAALEDLDGCVEMGVRFLTSPAPPQPCAAEPLPAGGVAYLAARRSHYAERERYQRENAVLGDELREAFHGLFRQTQIEPCMARGQSMLLLSFLVRRSDVGHFREAFRHFQQQSPARMLLTGPWPPYHFANKS